MKRNVRRKILKTPIETEHDDGTNGGNENNPRTGLKILARMLFACFTSKFTLVALKLPFPWIFGRRAKSIFNPVFFWLEIILYCFLQYIGMNKYVFSSRGLHL